MSENLVNPTLQNSLKTSVTKKSESIDSNSDISSENQNEVLQKTDHKSDKEDIRLWKKTKGNTGKIIFGYTSGILIIFLVCLFIIYRQGQIKANQDNISRLKANQSQINLSNQELTDYLKNLQAVYNEIIQNEKIDFTTAEKIQNQIGPTSELMASLGDKKNQLYELNPSANQAHKTILEDQKSLIEKRILDLDSLYSSLSTQVCLISKTTEESEKTTRVENLLSQSENETLTDTKNKLVDASNELANAIIVLRSFSECLERVYDTDISEEIKKALVQDLNFYERFYTALNLNIEGIDKNDENIINQANQVLSEITNVQSSLYKSEGFMKLIEQPATKASNLEQGMTAQTKSIEEKLEVLDK